ncbi:lipoate-protein ligase A [Coprinopsis cinerea okayama7|uniref:Putative lipoate-protein ligase A n=1 Tax=Coprinopsis cinerea (strain Okayama-7 / 130 / ATCC MYA-4618 / FGSC 9003) TaxID=240176 RepID=A8P6E4_COPC7|nr:lipoate-protein ligase A [Coprinopsis cinerea okayama7\|eukprot:XP_001839140.1 lipoate-protein ligase A [Coprinopsis cinerea okayama7\
MALALRTTAPSAVSPTKWRSGRIHWLNGLQRHHQQQQSKRLLSSGLHHHRGLQQSYDLVTSRTTERYTRMPPVFPSRSRDWLMPMTKGCDSLELQRRCYHSSSQPNRLTIEEDWPRRYSIFVSTSTDPYFNLTLEDMLSYSAGMTIPNPYCLSIATHRVSLLDVIRILGRKSTFESLETSISPSYEEGVVEEQSFIFDRNETAQVVVRAIRQLGVDANVNDRNDICVGKDKIRSAYKIVNNRAYHHGTMLISTRLDTLGDLLRVANKLFAGRDRPVHARLSCGGTPRTAPKTYAVKKRCLLRFAR